MINIRLGQGVLAVTHTNFGYGLRLATFPNGGHINFSHVITDNKINTTNGVLIIEPALADPVRIAAGLIRCSDDGTTILLLPEDTATDDVITSFEQRLVTLSWEENR